MWQTEKEVITLSFLQRALVRHWVWFAGSLAVVLSATTLYLFFAPPIYEARSKVLVENLSANILPTGLSNLFGSTSPEVATQLELMRQRSLLMEVRDQLGIKEPYREFSERFDFQQARGSNLIEIRATDEDPDKAAKLANTLMTAYVSFATDLYTRNPGSIAGRLENAIAEQEKKLNDLDKQLVNFLQSNRLSVPDKELGLKLEKLSDLIALRSQLSSGLRGTTKQISELRSQLGKQPDIQVTRQTYSIPPVVNTVVAKVIDLEIKKSELLREYQPDSVEVQEVEDQIQSAQDKLNEVLAATDANRQALLSRDEEPNPVRMEVASSLLKAEANRMMNQGVLDHVNRQIASMESELKNAPTLLVQYQSLARKHAAAQTIWTEKIRAYEQARAQQIVGRVSPLPLERATPPEFPVAPRTVFVTALGGLFGVMLGTLLAFWREMTDRRLSDRWAVEHLLNVPVLAELSGSSPSPVAVQPFFHALRALGGGEDWHEGLLVPVHSTNSVDRWSQTIQEGFISLNGTFSTVNQPSAASPQPAMESPPHPLAPIGPRSLMLSGVRSLTDPESQSAVLQADRLVLLVPAGTRLTPELQDIVQWLQPRLLGAILVHPDSRRAS